MASAIIVRVVTVVTVWTNAVSMYSRPATFDRSTETQRVCSTMDGDSFNSLLSEQQSRDQALAVRENATSALIVGGGVSGG